jgi:hypothetical protein
VGCRPTGKTALRRAGGRRGDEDRAPDISGEPAAPLVNRAFFKIVAAAGFEQDVAGGAPAESGVAGRVASGAPPEAAPEPPGTQS